MPRPFSRAHGQYVSAHRDRAAARGAAAAAFPSPYHGRSGRVVPVMRRDGARLLARLELSPVEPSGAAAEGAGGAAPAALMEARVSVEALADTTDDPTSDPRAVAILSTLRGENAAMEVAEAGPSAEWLLGVPPADLSGAPLHSIFRPASAEGGEASPRTPGRLLADIRALPAAFGAPSDLPAACPYLYCTFSPPAPAAARHSAGAASSSSEEPSAALSRPVAIEKVYEGPLDQGTPGSAFVLCAWPLAEIEGLIEARST